MDLTDIARELFECLTERIYTPMASEVDGSTVRERAVIEAYLDLEGVEDEVVEAD
jgi:hypothetical protein